MTKMFLKYKITSFNIMNLSVSAKEPKKNRKVYKQANRDKNTKEYPPKQDVRDIHLTAGDLAPNEMRDKKICPKSDNFPTKGTLVQILKSSNIFVFIQKII